MIGGWRLRIMNNRIGAVFYGGMILGPRHKSRPMQWIEVDLKGKLLGRWEVGAEWPPEAFTQSGALYTPTAATQSWYSIGPRRLGVRSLARPLDSSSALMGTALCSKSEAPAGYAGFRRVSNSASRHVQLKTRHGVTEACFFRHTPLKPRKIERKQHVLGERLKTLSAHTSYIHVSRAFQVGGTST